MARYECIRKGSFILSYQILAGKNVERGLPENFPEGIDGNFARKLESIWLKFLRVDAFAEVGECFRQKIERYFTQEVTR